MFIIVLALSTLSYNQQDQNFDVKSSSETLSRSLNFKSFTPTTSQQKLSIRKKSQTTNNTQAQQIPVTQAAEPPLRSKRYLQTQSFSGNGTWRVEREGTTIYLSDEEYQMLNSAGLIFVKTTTTKKVYSTRTYTSKSSGSNQVGGIIAGVMVGFIAFIIGLPIFGCYLCMFKKFQYKSGQPQSVCEYSNCKRLKPKHEMHGSLYQKAVENGIIQEFPDEQIMRALGIQAPVPILVGNMYGMNPQMMTGMNMSQIGMNQVSPYGVQQSQVQLSQYQSTMMNQTAGYQVNQVQYPNYAIPNTSIDKQHTGTLQTTPDNTFLNGLNDTSVIPMNKQIN
ncbi:UNKNOWN [Stylonychia lemnae]|uniref:Transmembrane protein n=1 Tax=Stylonychia lemnae TaxID=5949 RepID=A0A078AIS0_STYLE|nr:UNKNOWN [Stylonychia lemnae]|eukprot:CDW80708.1 UNKNOWN [Stylonychia lemnae]